MKKTISVASVILLLLFLCACGREEQASVTQPTQNKYQQIIDKLDAGDYEGAHAMIDSLESTGSAADPAEGTKPPAESSVATVQPTASPQNGTAVVLNEENVEEYFEVVTGYSFGSAPNYFQLLSLKEEYAQRVISLEDVCVTVSYLLSNAYGHLDEKENEFISEHYEIIGGQEVSVEIPVSDIGMVNFIQSAYEKKGGYFADFPVDVKIVDATGTLILTE